MKLWIAKVISLCLICLTQAVFVHLPIKIAPWFYKKGQLGKNIIQFLQCFAGGIFLGIYLLHMAPEVRELLHEQILAKHDISYPVPELIIGVGFFMVLFMEKIIMGIFKQGAVEPMISATDDKQFVEMKTENGNVIDTTTNNNKNDDNNTGTAVTSISNGVVVNVIEKNDMQIAIDHNNNKNSPENSSTTKNQQSNNIQLRSIFLQIALSLHCIFEGMSVGLKRTETAVWTMTLAICAHEVVVAFCLGLKLYETHKTNVKRHVIAGVIYSIDSPIGIAIGILITSVGGNQDKVDLTNGILQGLAAGTFIYVTFFEILYGNVTEDTKLVYIFAILIGFSVMAALSAIPEGDEKPNTGNNTTGNFL